MPVPHQFTAGISAPGCGSKLSKAGWRVRPAMHQQLGMALSHDMSGQVHYVGALVFCAIDNQLQGVRPPADIPTVRQPPQPCQGPLSHSLWQYGRGLAFQFPPSLYQLAPLLPFFLRSEDQVPSDARRDFHALVLALITGPHCIRHSSGDGK